MEDNRKDKSIPILIFCAIQIFIIVILISIFLIFRKDERISNVEYERQPATTIEDLASELPEKPDNFVSNLERELAKTIELNTDNFDMTNTKAEVRQNTLKIQRFNRLEGYFFSVVVDIPNLQQSYQIYNFYPASNSLPNSTPPNSLYVLCLDENTEKIYSNFNCKDNYPSETRRNIVASYLKYFDYDDISMTVDNVNPSVINITPKKYNINDSERKAFVEKTKEAVESLGVSSSIFEYHILELRHLG